MFHSFVRVDIDTSCNTTVTARGKLMVYGCVFQKVYERAAVHA